jgi:putative phosphoesterase
MRVGIVSDIHSNAAGLRAALDRMGDVDEVLCAGDMVESYRFSNEVVELLVERRAHCVLGNHDLDMIGPHGERARSAAHVNQTLVRHLGEQPLRFDARFDGRTVVMVHASPCAPHNQYVWKRSPELRRLAEIDADYIVLGHTHAQMAERVGRALVINPGSVGEARDHSNGRQLSYAVLDTTSGEVEFVDYSLDGTLDDTVSDTPAPMR